MRIASAPWAVGGAIVLLAAATARGGSPEVAAASGPASAAAAGEYVGEFRVTYYYVAEEDQRFARLPRIERLEDVSGRLLARVSREFRRELDREGTGRLADGRVINVATRRDGRWRYHALAPGSWGLGAGGERLEPFLSVACDPGWLALGTRIALPQLAGLLQPDGRPHSGVFRVADTGSAIREARIDVFLGRRSHLAAAERKVPSHAPTPVFRLPAACPGERP